MGFRPQVKSTKKGWQQVVLLLGSNQLDPLAQLEIASARINDSCGFVVRKSPVYITSPWGITDQPAFLNQALLLNTLLPPVKLMLKLLDIETQMGRVRTIKWGPRIIDIDMLVYGQQVSNHASLQLPHPGLPNRRFALVPLVQVWSDWYHPVLKVQAKTLLSRTNDPGKVFRFL
jgi:2-amino-4-hydroxy-6-hydroxymethyldihydropteridine diphosphokinase